MSRPVRIAYGVHGYSRGHAARALALRLRDEVHQIEPSPGAHLLVYLNQGNVQLTPSLLRALGRVGAPVKLYGTERSGTAGTISYQPPSSKRFLEDLASCRAVVSTAGREASERVRAPGVRGAPIKQRL